MRRFRRLVCALATIVASLAGLWPLGAQPVAGEGVAPLLVCSYTTGVDVNIPDGICSDMPSALNLACPLTAGKTLVSVEVSVDIQHTWVGDLIVTVNNPSRSVTLWSREGGSAEDIIKTWVLQDFDGDPVGGLWWLAARDCAGSDVGYINSWSIKIIYVESPSIIAATPNAGGGCTGAMRSFATTVEEPGGAGNVDVVDFLFDSGTWMQDSVYLRYIRGTNKVYLRNAADTAWLGGVTLGADQLIENKWVTVHVQDCSTSVTDNRLTVNWALEFQPALARAQPYAQRLYVSNLDGLSAGWSQVGSWGVQVCGTPATPTVTRTPTRTPTFICNPITRTYQQGYQEYGGALDAGLRAWSPDTNYGGETGIELRADDQMAGLLRFDLSSIPVGAEIIEATLSLYVAQHDAVRPITVGAYELLRPWFEGQATWNRAKSDVYWGQPGANGIGEDRVGAPGDEFTVDGVANAWYDLDLRALVAQWVKTPSSNRGLALKAFGNATSLTFNSSEHATQSLRPKLTIRYNPCGVATATRTVTRTPTVTRTSTLRATPTRTATWTATWTLTPKPTKTATATPTRTVRPTRTRTPTPAPAAVALPLLLK